ncbi:hypothetical protein FACS189426_22430 [Bacteroidia bacterium]|nr:hypothetical protein FACS189426_22430 [Bacteroidia bacterium]
MKMKHYYSTFFVGLFLLLASSLEAAPAFPLLIKLQQPNGEEISLYMKGDEKVHWMESEDGYSLLYDKNKYIVYATTDEAGNMVPSNTIAKNISLRSASSEAELKKIQKKLRYSSAQIKARNEVWNMLKTEQPGLRSSVGTAHAICALIEFPDKPMGKTQEDFEKLMNQAGYNASGAEGSVKDFYRENSYGQLDLVVTVVGPYTASKNWAYYGENDTERNDSDKHAQELAMEAANFAFNDPNINPADYDNDGDGYIDTFHFIYAGNGEESGAGSDAIWAHKYGFNTISFGNKKLRDYSCSPELRGSISTSITHIGVICHELCHIFGAPDFYDANTEEGGEYEGTGNWDLMARGSWNNNGASPAHINMYQKIQLGWVNPVILNSPQIISNMPNSAQNTVAYRIDTPVSGEYYILENRQKIGFDKAIPGTGLLIYHVSLTGRDITTNTVNSTHPQKMYPVCASSNVGIPSAVSYAYGSINSAGCPFPGSSGKTAFSDYTIPAAFTWRGDKILKPLTDIQERNNLISFRFAMPDVDPVGDLNVSVSNQNVQLSWNKPNENVTGYNVYRNNELLIKLSGKNSTTYTQNQVSAGKYNYCVTAVYADNKESMPSCNKEEITVSGNSRSQLTVKNLNVSRNPDNHIQLSWESPFVNSWFSHAGDPSSIVYYESDANEFTVVTRLTADDLGNFWGSQLTKVRFYLYNISSIHKIQVWSVSGDTPTTPIVEQAVSSSKIGYIDVTLNQPVSVENGKELWIGIHYQLNPMTHVAIADKGPVVPNRNFVFMDDTWYSLNEEEDDFNWCIAGYLDFGENAANAPANNWLKAGSPAEYKIFRDNNLLANVQDTRYVDTSASGNAHIYCVSVSVNNQESEQICVQSTPTGIQTIPKENAVKTYPNPIQRGETLTIDLGDDFENTILSFYTLSGQLVGQQKASGTIVHKKIDWTPGIYLLQIKNGASVTNLKLIIK